MTRKTFRRTRPGARQTLAALMVAAGLAGAAPLVASVPALAQEDGAAAETGPTVLARVGEDVVTEDDFRFAIEEMGSQLANMPPAQQRDFLLNMLIDMKVMARAAREAEMDQTEAYQARKDYLEERALRRAYLEQVIQTSVTDEDVQAAYDEFVQGFEPEQEVRARHILLGSEDDAKAVIAELEAGRDFAELAKEKSTGPTGPNGGDLGYFTKDRMVPPFAEAAFALEPGQISEPVETQFGWHVIKLEDKKESAPPAFEEVEQGLRQQMLYEKFEEIVGQLRSETTIEIVGAEDTAAEGEEAAE
ncbi:peptidylprolyl isomerase [Cucumibacter marinus]|uniref:peptidylprolyl isomerase n=1 Tax=Cucumibacter marinus TaxID=1121252 RepID=UPI00040C4295|nr:peptidylprolyl isomerase [Cucumibacter marinus]